MLGRAFGTALTGRIASTARYAATTVERGVAIALLAPAVAGCASILDGRSQEIAVSTDPPGAECGFYREEGKRIATIERTPGNAVVKKTRNDIWIVCTKPGYQPAVYLNHSGAALANVVGGIFTLGISTAVDTSTGAGNEYQSPANVVMLPGARGTAEAPIVLPRTFTADKPAGSYSQQVAMPQGAIATPGEPLRALPPITVAASMPAPPPDPAPTVQAIPAVAPARPVAAPVPAANTLYDGFYSGSVDVRDASVNSGVAHQRQIDVRVANGVGNGTLKHPLCDEPGQVSFAIDAAGTIRGRANTRNTVGCTERLALLEGRMDGAQMHLFLRVPGTSELVMSKTQAAAASAPVAAAAPPPRGRFDGTYSGAMDLAAGDPRQVWLRVVGTKGSGSVRRLSCPQPGLVTIEVATDGSISGNADVVSSAGSSCATRTAAVKGEIRGTRMGVTLVFPDGQTSSEFAFNRRSYE
jgi:hypothetical protein